MMASPPGQGDEAALAVGEHERLRLLDKAGAPTFANLPLAIPQDDGAFERNRLPPRPAGFPCS